MFDGLTIKILNVGQNPALYRTNGIIRTNEFIKIRRDGEKEAIIIDSSLFARQIINAGDVVVFLNYESEYMYGVFLDDMNILRFKNGLPPIQIIKSSKKKFNVIGNADYSRGLNVNVYMNRELMSEDEIMTDVKAKVCRALRCNDPDMLIINIEEMTIKMRVPNHYKIIYPNKLYKRKTLIIDHSRENVLKELVKDEPLIQIVRIIKKGDNRFNVYVIQKVSQSDTLEKLNDLTLLDATSPVTPRAGRTSKKIIKKSKGNKKSKKR